MRKIIIGIVARLINSKGVYIQKVPNNLIKLFKKLNVEVLIIPDTNKRIDLSMFSGFIIIGGKKYSKTDEHIIKYAVKNDLPLIGICAGMQAIACYKHFNRRKSDYTVKIKNKKHYSKRKYVHKVLINEKSLLKDIIKKNTIFVNSRHHYRIVAESYLNIEAISIDNVIEAISFKNKSFILGLQWHPEDLFDINSLKIFKYFISKCNK